ncbi:MAG: hypothetical protein U0746_08290 [Gemmataceae bacterium]
MFGSAVVRVAPDTASVVVAVCRTEQKPEAAFVKARDGAQGVTAYLHSASESRQTPGPPSRAKDYGTRLASVEP